MEIYQKMSGRDKGGKGSGTGNGPPVQPHFFTLCLPVKVRKLRKIPVRVRLLVYTTAKIEFNRNISENVWT